MALIKRKDIDQLLNNQNGLCISIFIPTHHNGAEVLNGQDSILFKNRVREAEDLLRRHDVSDAEIKEMMKPAEALLADGNFWRHRSQGLAVFITKNFSTHFSLPIAPKEEVYVLDQFYFTPILPLLSQNGRFFVLVLNRNKVEFFEATIERFRAINISEMLPDTFNQALKFDVKGHDQDFHNSTTTNNGTNIVHGAGASKGDEEHERVREFMLAIDNGLQTILHQADEPLVLCGVEHYCGIFRNISKYKNIVPQNISIPGNPDNLDRATVHAKALEVVRPLMQQDHVSSLDRYENVAGTGRTSEDIARVAAEAVHGRVDTLFITPGNPIWGTYDQDQATAVIHDNYHRGDDDLINLAAIKTLAQGGKVYVSSYNGMAETTNGTGGNANAGNVKALFRY